MASKYAEHITLIEDYVPTWDAHEDLRQAVELRAQQKIERPGAPTHFNGKLIKDLSYEERQEFYLSMQPASTQAVLRRDPKDDEKAWDRPILNWKAVADADMSTPEGRAKAVGMRPLTPEEVIVDRSNKQGRNNQFSSKESGVSKERREKSIWGFSYSQPVKLSELSPEDLKKISKMVEIKNRLLDPLQEKEGSKLMQWFRDIKKTKDFWFFFSLTIAMFIASGFIMWVQYNAK